MIKIWTGLKIADEPTHFVWCLVRQLHYVLSLQMSELQKKAWLYTQRYIASENKPMLKTVLEVVGWQPTTFKLFRNFLMEKGNTKTRESSIWLSDLSVLDTTHNTLIWLLRISEKYSIVLLFLLASKNSSKQLYYKLFSWLMACKFFCFVTFCHCLIFTPPFFSIIPLHQIPNEILN